MSTGRRLLAGVCWLLASLLVLSSTFAVWAHQTLLTAEGWGGIVGEVIADEEVVDTVSTVLVDRLADRLGVQEAVAEALPGPDLIVGALARVVQDRVTEAVATFASTDAFQEAFVRANERAHEAAMRTIRGGDREAVAIDEGVIALQIFPLVEGVLLGLQDAGIVDESRDIPDLSDPDIAASAIEGLESVLGRDIPDDIGTIVLVDSENLELIQTVVRWADVGTALLLLAWAGFSALALWLWQPRLRMLAWLAAGALVALLLGRLVTRLVLEAAASKERAPGVQVLVDAIIAASEQSFLLFSFVLMAVAAVVGLAALLRERSNMASTTVEA